MKFLLDYDRWKRVKKQLRSQGLVKLPNTGSWHNYTLPLFPPEYYPRLHIITSNGQARQTKDTGGCVRMLEVHVDIKPHFHTEQFHPAINMVQNIIKHTK